MGDSDDRKKRILSQWEPVALKRLAQRSNSFSFVRNVEEEAETVLEGVARVEALVNARITAWLYKPTSLERDAILVVALLVADGRQWGPKNDMVSAMLFRLVLGSGIRGHSDGVVRYRQCAFQDIEEIVETDMRRVEKTLQLAAHMFRHLMRGNVSFDETLVFQSLAQCAGGTHEWKPVTSADFKIKKDEEYAAWAFDACQQTIAMVSNFTRREMTRTLVDLIGTWMQSDRPDPPSTGVAFPDTYLHIDDQARGEARVSCKEKSAKHDCYFLMDINIGVVVPDWAEADMRYLLASCWADNEVGFNIDTAKEVLCWMNELIPPVGILLTGDGGKCKSARTLLRCNVWGKHHKVVASQCFQKDDELRIQGCHFAHARIITAQEAEPGKPVCEPELKKVLSGEYYRCRPLFGKETKPYRWNRCGFWWEFNNLFFSIKGNPDDLRSLRSWTKRFIVLRLKATFTGDPSKVDLDRCIFPEDSEIAAFLEGAYARVAFVKLVLIPWVKLYTAAETRRIIVNPPDSVVENTRRVVATMANGGIDVPASICTKAEEDAKVKEAMRCVRLAWKASASWGVIKTYDVKRIRALPGTYRSGCKGASREDTFSDAVMLWPHLLHYNPLRCGHYERLSVDLEKLDHLLEQHGEDVFGGGFEHWDSVWECKKELRTCCDWDFATDEGSVLAERNDAGVLYELANWTNTSDALESGQCDSPDNLRAYIGRATRIGSDFCQSEVLYYRKHGIPGRRYAHGGHQHLSRRDKRVLYYFPEGNSYEGAPVLVDIDIDNCFATLLVNKLVEHCDKSEFRVLIAFK